MADIEEFMRIEVENRLFERSIVNVNYWQLIRGEFFLKCVGLENNAGESHPDLHLTRNGWMLPLAGFKLLCNTFKNIKENSRIDFVNSIAICSCRRYTLNSMEILLKYYDSKVCFIDRPFQYGYLPFDHNAQRFVTSVIDLKRGLKIKLYQNFPCKLKQYCEAEMKYIHSVFEGMYYKLPTLEWMSQRAIHKIITYLEVIACFSGLWKNSPPKVLLINNRTDGVSLALISAAHKLGIPVIEVLHGYVPYYDPCYNYPNYNFRYKDCIVPDVTLIYGDYWKKGIRGQKQEKIMSCGSLELEYFQKKYANKTKRNYITFISQGPFSNVIYPMAIKLAEFLQKNGKLEEYKILYKLHPNEVLTWKRLHPDYYDPRILLISTTMDVYQLMSESIVFIGINSTALFESLAFDVKVGIINSAHLTEDMIELCDKGYVTLIQNEADIYQLVLSDFSLDEGAVEFFWKRNALSNALKIINEITVTK